MSELLALLLQSRQDPTRIVVETGDNSSSLWVSLASAVIALIALAVTLWRESRERPDISVDMTAGWGPEGPALTIRVVNSGRLPATVGPVTLVWNVDQSASGAHLSGEILVGGDPNETDHLDAGTSVAKRWLIPEQLPVHVDTPLRPVVYVGRKRVYGRPLSILRAITLVRPDFPELLQLPADELPSPPRSRRVTAWWKLWRPQHERRSMVVPVDPRSRAHSAASDSEFAGSMPPGVWSRPAAGRGGWRQRLPADDEDAASS